jgi:hypothetical protein
MHVQRIAFVGLCALWLGCWACLAAADEPVTANGPVDYNRQIRPLLSNHCFKCHGPDAEQREGGFRLDVRESAVGEADSGARPIVPGQSAASEVVRRINAASADERMPPADENKPLSAADKELLTRWIAEGAKYQTHWSFVRAEKPSLPTTSRPAWARGGLDTFILARLQREGLAPSPEADKPTLIRRLTLDLTGLPPSLMEVDGFLADEKPDAVERLVDRLQASPRFGERMAVDWLDAARFADTHGYHIDAGRDMSRWREYVIDSFNRNVPYDQFTVEQIAGDLLPATGDAERDLRQKLASGFNRNHMINFEGGAIPQEYLTAYIVDRVNTTGTVFLGLTVGCAQCHDHKYDPLTQREFYQLYAFFNNLPEQGLDGRKGNAPPLIRFPAPELEQQLAQVTAEIKEVEARIAEAGKKTDEPQDVDAIKKLRDELKALKSRQGRIEAARPTSMTMEEMPQPRETFVLFRGAYDKPGEKVTSDVPAFLPPLPKDGGANRLALARWLISPEQPLTARVTVNRYWQMFFGTGLVRTVEDFGSQGELPSHPELLDWLAVEFRGRDSSKFKVQGSKSTGGDDGLGTEYSVLSTQYSASRWDLKRLIRNLVTSATYRQSSAVAPALRAKDPDNRLLARGPRFRLQAEFIRDQALFHSGLLDGRIGGQSVSPYQPPGLWEELMSRSDGDNWTAQKYEQSHGVDLYRRTMYTFWKRTCPPPSLATLDAPDRETCIVRRSRTNTPLQALVLMNDPTYVEASRKFAERIMREGGSSTGERVSFAFRSVTARQPTAAELSVLQQVYERQLAGFRELPQAAASLLKIGESPADPQLEPAELAAWAVVASAISNADEVLSKG